MLHILPVLVDGQGFGATGDVFKTHRHEVPDVDVDAVARTSPIIVDTAEELPASAGVVSGDH